MRVTITLLLVTILCLLLTAAVFGHRVLIVLSAAVTLASIVIVIGPFGRSTPRTVADSDRDRADAAALKRIADLALSLSTAEREREAARADARKAAADLATVMESLCLVRETVPVLSALADIAIDKSRSGSTTLTDDIYRIADESRKLGESIAAFLTRLSTGDASLQHRLHDLTEDNRRLETVRETFDQTDRMLSASIDTISTSVMVTGDLLSHVTEIAEQTSILAINAAIYAAKAGDHGKGFTVIASEIQRLASTSKEVAQKIGENTSAIERHVADLTRRYQDLIAESRGSLEETSASLSATIEGLSPEMDRMEESIRQASSVSAAMTGRLSECSMAMQEQDAIQQIVGHMVDILQTAFDEAVSSGASPVASEAESERMGAAARERVRAIATACFSMKDEFDAIEHDGYVEEAARERVTLTDGTALDGDITLF
ncbi:MAG: hypothetical protein EA382_19115 [Spirochaetaceae bacterium]|nr:MAG: hypothetical protein EA382_19115 [Spirochaetaceae bacterium]